MNRPPFSPRRRWLILATWVVVGLAALPFAARVNEVLDAGVRLQGSESSHVEETLRRQITDRILSTPGVRGVLSYLDRDDSLFLGEDGTRQAFNPCPMRSAYQPDQGTDP